MFMRRGESKDVRPAGEPTLTELQLREEIQHARTAATPITLAGLQQQPPIAQPLAAPPPMPGPAPAAAIEVPLAQDAEPRSVIGEDLTIEGQSITIRCRGALEVNGRIQAELHSQTLVVGRSGQVEGTVAADNIDVWGHVSGTIMGARVVLHPTAEVEGDIHAKSLSVADGASFEGRSRKVTDAAAIAPRLDPAAPSMTPAEPAPIPVSRHTVVSAA